MTVTITITSAHGTVTIDNQAVGTGANTVSDGIHFFSLKSKKVKESSHWYEATGVTSVSGDFVAIGWTPCTVNITQDGGYTIVWTEICPVCQDVLQVQNGKTICLSCGFDFSEKTD